MEPRIVAVHAGSHTEAMQLGLPAGHTLPQPREGLDETLTVMRLNLPSSLRRTFATTNAIENMNGSLRRITRNVKRWKDEAMIRRWIALGIAEAQKGFRRVKGYRNMPSLIAALRKTNVAVATEKKVA